METQKKSDELLIHLGAEVSCADGMFGLSTHVLVNPVTRKVTYLVAQETTPQHPEYVVPVKYVTAGSANIILLQCTRDELRHMEPFVQTQYIYEPMPDYDSAYPIGSYYMCSYVVPEFMTQVPVEQEQVPPGELDVRRGMLVEATDGTVGYVDEFMMNPGTGNITHLVMREGHLFGQKDVTIPISAIDKATDDTVTLNLSKQQITALPSIPVRRPPFPRTWPIPRATLSEEA